MVWDVIVSQFTVIPGVLEVGNGIVFKRFGCLRINLEFLTVHMAEGN